MSTERNPTDAADLSDSGPDEGEQNAEGQSTTGGDDGGPDSSEAGETPTSTRKPDTDTRAADHDDALTKALMSGSMDDMDEDGKPKAKAADDEEAPPADDEPKGKDTTDKEVKPPGPDDHTAEEAELIAKAPTKKIGKELDTLFKERRDLRKQTEEATAKAQTFEAGSKFADGVIDHATSAGLITEQDGKPNYSGLQNLIEEHKHLRNLPPEKVADYYRKLADDISPLPKPVELPQDLADLVAIESLSKAEAQKLAKDREDAKAPPKPIAPKPPAAAAPTGPTLAQVQASKAGMDAIAKVAAPFKSRFPAEWEAIGGEVMKRIQPRLAKSDPSVWGDLVQTELELAVERRRTVTKTPPKTPRPNGAPPKKGDEIMSEEDEIDALSKGRL